MDVSSINANCPECGGHSLLAWEVTAAGGTSPPLLPLPILAGPKCVLRCCLSCGLMRWYASADALVDLRARNPSAPSPESEW